MPRVTAARRFGFQVLTIPRHTFISSAPAIPHRPTPPDAAKATISTPVPGSLVNGDVTNYPPPSFSPDTGLFYVPENNSLRITYLIDADPRGSMGLGGTQGGGGMSYGSYIDAIDYKTGKVAWRHEISGG